MDDDIISMDGASTIPAERNARRDTGASNVQRTSNDGTGTVQVLTKLYCLYVVVAVLIILSSEWYGRSSK